MRARFERHDLSGRRRVLAAGDVHGCFDLLEKRLDELGFDPELDVLILLGDLVDRGDYSDEALDWCQKPGVLRILGNHEQLTRRAVVGSEMSMLHHVRNGGVWLCDIEDEVERRRWADIIVDCPIAIEAVTPAGRRVGFIHADVPTASWPEIERALAIAPDLSEKRGAGWDSIWGRERINGLKHHAREHGTIDGYDCSVPGIEHVFFGHTIVSEPVTVGNCSWIDTGAFKRDVLTVVDVDAWIAEYEASEG